MGQLSFIALTVVLETIVKVLDGVEDEAVGQVTVDEVMGGTAEVVVVHFLKGVVVAVAVVISEVAEVVAV